ncbi:MAG: catalase [Cyanothece sp. SIO2G6]|nr:catalase [Cyanothece sp. SIO2G6]
MNLFTEYPEKDEQQRCDRVTQVTRKRMEDLYGNGDKALRDTHAKTHAAVRATLEMLDFDEQSIKQAIAKHTGLSESQLSTVSLKQGLLAQAKTYPVWLRFANGRTSVEHDYDGDTRSMSVKVMGVEGDRLLASHEQHSQDFVVQNADIFFIETIQNYYGFFSSVAKSKLWALVWLLLHPKQRGCLKTITSRTPKSLLTERYWSGSASALGLPDGFDPTQPGTVPVTYPLAVKYAFTPVAPAAPHSPLTVEMRSPSSIEQAKTAAKNGVADNYYRDDLIQSLGQAEAKYCWDFQIQVQASPEQSIDNVTMSWDETKAPFFTVGRLTVTSQTIDSEAQQTFAENIQFSPWNGLTVHRPIGALNRLRRLVYPLVADYRHYSRHVEYQEPTGYEQF